MENPNNKPELNKIEQNEKYKIELNEIDKIENLDNKFESNIIDLNNVENSNIKIPLNILKTLEISLAPMLEVTTANFRRFVRLTSKHTILFTEMIVSNTVLHISRDKLLERLGKFDPLTVVQIGGSDPEEISLAISILKEYGYTQFNLNVGCPSSRVQKGCFGAVLMKDKELVSNIVKEVIKRCGITISLKIRVGVDDLDSYEFFHDFVSHLIEAGVTKFYVHGRKCWLDGLSPKQNRNVPSLNYDFVYRIKTEFPEIQFYLNGGLKGIKDFDKLKTDQSPILENILDGMMIGREAIKNILVFKNIEDYLYGASEKSLLDIVKEYLGEFDPDSPISFRILFPLQHILHGKRGTKKWKIFLNDSVHKRKLSVEEFTSELDNIDYLQN